MYIRNDVPTLTQYFKTLADENRLRMIAYLGKQEHSVGELATLLELTEPTVSHHLTRLREAGLVNMRAMGNQRLYRLDQRNLKRLAERLADLEHIQLEDEAQADDSWIDALDLDAADRKVLHGYIANGRLKDIPVKRPKLLVILRWLAGCFEPDRTYSEQEVNAILTQYHEDYASLRRELVDFGFLRRERGGGQYWLTPEDETK
ncbi:MAG: metalloregulator ArsR/SmtB family transcription factor [Anaerolineae bacterium]|nr:metalloregulator ArsR/SmtB family transcription factor [Anaerolineae bacterium]